MRVAPFVFVTRAGRFQAACGLARPFWRPVQR